MTKKAYPHLEIKSDKAHILIIRKEDMRKRILEASTIDEACRLLATLVETDTPVKLLKQCILAFDRRTRELKKQKH